MADGEREFIPDWQTPNHLVCRSYDNSLSGGLGNGQLVFRNSQLSNSNCLISKNKWQFKLSVDSAIPLPENALYLTREYSRFRYEYYVSCYQNSDGSNFSFPQCILHPWNSSLSTYDFYYRSSDSLYYKYEVDRMANGLSPCRVGGAGVDWYDNTGIMPIVIKYYRKTIYTDGRVVTNNYESQNQYGVTLCYPWWGANRAVSDVLLGRIDVPQQAINAPEGKWVILLDFTGNGFAEEDVAMYVSTKKQHKMTYPNLQGREWIDFEFYKTLSRQDSYSWVDNSPFSPLWQSVASNIHFRAFVNH